MESKRANPMAPVWMGCLGATIVGIISSCGLLGLLLAPALGGALPDPPVPDPVTPDITIFVQEAYLDRMLTGALPASMGESADLDVRGDNRLVLTANIDVLLAQLDVTIILSMFAENGELKLGIESIEAAGEELMDLLDLDEDSLSEMMGGTIQEQIEAGLGEGARILGVRMDEERIILTARWP